MNWLSAAVKELLSLFVDDVGFSIAILVWVALATLVIPTFPIDPGWHAPLLFVGCAAILVVSSWRSARA